MDLESVRVSRAGRRLLLRVVVDADGGVGLDDIADVSRDVAAVIERDDEMRNAPYTLEVSSPGVDRPLTEPKHWRRAAGRLVSAPLAASGQPPGGRAADGKAAAGKTRDGEAAASRPASVQGRVIAATSDAVTLEVDGATRAFGYDELGPGRVQVEFARAAAGQDGQKGQGGPEGTDSGEPATPDRGDGGLTDGH
jgi:ribosome maturation factor RimP